jgi:inositol oxygenase
MPSSTFTQVEYTSDAVDEGMIHHYNLNAKSNACSFEVNQLKGCLWNSEAEFAKEKDTTSFRQYEDACDRVKGFYQEQHGLQKASSPSTIFNMS